MSLSQVRTPGALPSGPAQLCAVHSYAGTRACTRAPGRACRSGWTPELLAAEQGGAAPTAPRRSAHGQGQHRRPACMTSQLTAAERAVQDDAPAGAAPAAPGAAAAAAAAPGAAAPAAGAAAAAPAPATSAADAAKLEATYGAAALARYPQLKQLAPADLNHAAPQAVVRAAARAADAARAYPLPALCTPRHAG